MNFETQQYQGYRLFARRVGNGWQVSISGAALETMCFSEQEAAFAEARKLIDNSGRKTGAEMARLYNVSAPTVSRIVAHHLATASQ